MEQTNPTPQADENPQPMQGDYPAFVEDTTAALEEKQYRVNGEQAVFGWQHGETFSATFTPEQEAYYLTGGHLVVVTGDEPQQEEVKASVETKPDTAVSSESEGVANG